MDLRKTLLLAHDLLDSEKIDHALIGGLAMVNLGLTRATIDVDLLIEDENKEKARTLLINISREFQDKADIQFLIENYLNLDWNKIKSYADLFSKWSEIEEIKNKINI